jgi:Raf kinase inhibitor-like YbhB/YbcL family protein
MFTLISLIMTIATHIAALKVTSPAFQSNGKIPPQYTCDGAGKSPALHLVGTPLGTKSLAIIVHDPDAPHVGGVTHWMAWNINPAADIPEGFGNAGSGNGQQGKNTKGNMGYMGPCPPNGSHHYHFRIYALDTQLSMDTNTTTRESLEKAMNGHILAQGDLVGLYR